MFLRHQSTAFSVSQRCGKSLISVLPGLTNTGQIHRRNEKEKMNRKIILIFPLTQGPLGTFTITFTSINPSKTIKHVFKVLKY
ncbi:hypothetical protein COL30_06460 [Bacillus pseudomycoides]|nr:hypothetical protein COO19_05320 [Bacillus pseudomycoides]PEI41014.1 hypothetical protein CN620_13845 [Bacillus pseudomycoides]PEK24897.1 hypothetical protein CN693_11250 [Bacillus pseudomycoides]PEP69239.1 hypothetical protein CN591_06295 [Bacillus pseudomycoides]PFW66684.1 hypothetical protein COL25_20260 [Bacillus pseudomycoides]